MIAAAACSSTRWVSWISTSMRPTSVKARSNSVRVRAPIVQPGIGDHVGHREPPAPAAAGKHRSTVNAMARKYKATVETPAGPRKCLQVVIERDRGRKPLVARFGGIPLRRVRTAVLTDQRPIMASTRRYELIHRLLAGRCEICEDTAGLEVHHVRKLADVTKPGRRDKPEWMRLMAMRRRKTRITCRRCHEDIHTGRATRPYPK